MSEPAPHPGRLSTAFGWAWNAFTRNAVTLIVPTAIYGVLFAAASTLNFLGQNMSTNFTKFDFTDYNFSMDFSPTGVAVIGLGYVVSLVVTAYAQAAFFAGCLDIADGRPVSIGSFFKPRNLGMAFLAAFLVSVVTAIGYAACFLPGLLVGIFTQFTILFVVDRAQSAGRGFTSGVALVWSNFVAALLVWLVSVAAIVVGSLACGIGLLVTVPVAALIMTHVYRTLSGGQVAPAAPPGPLPA